ncbi:MAG: hypothetical protein WCG91_01820 [Candidatus Shapirobacteria bacterium]
MSIENGKFVDPDIIGKLPNGQDLYRADPSGDMYKDQAQVDEEKRQELLNQHPEKDRRYFSPTTKVENFHWGKGLQSDYRGGYTFGETMAVRVLDESGKEIKSKGFIRYKALSVIKFFYEIPKSGGKKRELRFSPGQTFWAPKACEDKEKKKEMLVEDKKKKEMLLKSEQK